MVIEIKLNKLSGHAKEGKVGKIYKQPGDILKEADILLEVESDKGNMAVKPDVVGEIISIEVEEGTTAKIGDVLAKIEAKQMDKKPTEKAGQSQNKDTSKNAGAFNYFGGLIKPSKEELQSDITIIGGGPGGYVAAIQAAKLGAKVVLVEKENLGGTCLNWGCIPTKAFVRSAEVYKNLKEAEAYGMQTSNSTVNMTKVVERKNNIVKQLVQGIEYLMKKNNVTIVKGFGEIKDINTVYVKSGNVETTIHSRDIIIATGSSSCQLPFVTGNSKNVITSKEVLDMEKLPESMVVIGGGVIGMEFAFIFSAFGVKVSVIEYLDSILASFDKDICRTITKAAKDTGISLFTGAKVIDMIDSENGHTIVSFEKNHKTKYITAEKVLVAVGRQPCLTGMEVNTLGIELNDNGKGIKVNEKMQTSIPNIYAIGDVTNKLQLAHVASHQGIVAVKNIMEQATQMDYNVIPSAVFTDPEIAVVGMSEKTAKEQGIEIEVGKFPFSANGKALTLGENRGFVKVIKEKSTGKIIGGAIIGPHATDLIAEIALAVKNNLTAEQVIETIHAHPTTAEAIHEAMLATEGGAIHFA